MHHISLSTKKECPVCRSPEVNISSSHYIVNGILSIVVANTTYNCFYENCNKSLKGIAIVDHQKFCRLKVVPCPKRGCEEGHHRISSLAEDQHPCVEIVRPLKPDSKVWSTTINLDDLFSMDYYRLYMSRKLLPKLLCNPNASPPFDRLFLDIGQYTASGIMLFMGCLSLYDEVSNLVDNYKSHLEAYVFTKEGTVGYTNLGRIMCHNEKISRANDGIYLNNQTLTNWIKWTHDHPCKICPKNKKPHMHISASVTQIKREKK